MFVHWDDVETLRGDAATDFTLEVHLRFWLCHVTIRVH